MTKTERKLLDYLVERLDGHSVGLLPRDTPMPINSRATFKPGFSVGTGRHVVLAEIVAICREPDE